MSDLYDEIDVRVEYDDPVYPSSITFIDESGLPENEAYVEIAVEYVEDLDEMR